MEQKLTKQDCAALLTERYQTLQESGENRYPRRSDFSDAEVMAIKAFFGPWPRALESCGIKEPRSGEKKEKLLQKRIEAKRKKTERKKQKAMQDKTSEIK